MSHHYICFDNVSYQYTTGRNALNNVSFKIMHGEKVAIVGANGAGKSTLMLHLNGLLLPTNGQVTIGDIPITKNTLRHIRRAVGVVFQNPDDQLFMPTVYEDVAFGPTNMNLPKDEIANRVYDSLKAVGISHLAERTPYSLSGGEKRSVAIAGVIAMHPNILALDEPSSNLDPHSRNLLIKQINNFTHTVLLISHDIDLVCRTCHRTLVMSEGRIIADNSTHEIFSDTPLLSAANLL